MLDLITLYLLFKKKNKFIAAILPIYSMKRFHPQNLRLILEVNGRFQAYQTPQVYDQHRTMLWEVMPGINGDRRPK